MRTLWCPSRLRKTFLKSHNFIGASRFASGPLHLGHPTLVLRIGGTWGVVEVPATALPKPWPVLGGWLMHAPPHLRFDHLELCLHAVPPGFPFDLEFALPSLAANEGEAKEVEGLRLAEPAPQRRRSAAKRPNSMSRVFSGCSVSANFCNRS